MAKYVFGLKSVKFGTPTGTAAMPAALDMEEFAQTVRGSMTLSETEPTVQDFNVEEQDAPVEQAITESSKLELTWRAYDLSPAIIEIVKGGDGSTLATTWTAPAKTTMIKLAIEIETDGGSTIAIPNANIVARLDGVIGREDMLQLEVKGTALDPGDGGSPFSVVFPA